MSIANGVQSDLRELGLLSTARASIATKVGSILNYYVPATKTSIALVEAAYVTFASENIMNTIQFNSNFSAFESLKNSSYFRKIQGTDLALLLSTYFTNAAKIKTKETGHNQACKKLVKHWRLKFKNNGAELYLKPWLAKDFSLVAPQYLEVLRDDATLAVFEVAGYEAGFIKTYDEQILMGKSLLR